MDKILESSSNVKLLLSDISVSMVDMLLFGAFSVRVFRSLPEPLEPCLTIGRIYSVHFLGIRTEVVKQDGK